jgi:hypothetical protein
MANYIQIDQIDDGMVLAEPIVNSYGQSLLGAGTKLSQTHVRLLKTWNIRVVCVKSSDGEEEVQLSDEQKVIAEREIVKRMSWLPRNEIEKDLFKMGVMQTAFILSKKSSGDHE